MSIVDGLNQITAATFIGFGLAMGVMIYIAVFKTLDTLITKLINRCVKAKPLSLDAKKGSKVIFANKLYLVKEVVDTRKEAKTITFQLVGINTSNLIVFTIQNNEGA